MTAGALLRSDSDLEEALAACSLLASPFSSSGCLPAPSSLVGPPSNFLPGLSWELRFFEGTGDLLQREEERELEDLRDRDERSEWWDLLRDLCEADLRFGVLDRERPLLGLRE